MDRLDLHDTGIFGEALEGVCFPQTRHIFLDMRLKGDALLETWLHELLHSLFPAASPNWTDEQEEQIVTMLAPKLLEALRATGWVKK